MSEPFEPEDFYGQQQEYMFGIIGFHEDAPRDQVLHDYFWDYMYNDEQTPEEKAQTYEDLLSYLQDEYDLDFEDLWDWEDFREWYAEQ